MENPRRTSIQATVKSVCSISYVSEKLQVSRPTLYKYMDLYDAPTLGGWVAVRYDASDITDPDTDLNTLLVDGVELQTIG